MTVKLGPKVSDLCVRVLLGSARLCASSLTTVWGEAYTRQNHPEGGEQLLAIRARVKCEYFLRL